MLEMDQLEYTDVITGLMIQVKEHTVRQLALDLWKYYPNETQMLYASLAQTQHTKPLPRLLMKE